jgi:hypothetical protein
MNDENVDGWTKVTKGGGKCARKPAAKRTQIFPACVNRFSVLSNLKGSSGKSEMNDENVDGWTKVTKGDGKCARKRIQIFPA